MPVAGAVAGGGLTVIANSPNPAGVALLKESGLRFPGLRPCPPSLHKGPCLSAGRWETLPQAPGL